MHLRKTGSAAGASERGGGLCDGGVVAEPMADAQGHADDVRKERRRKAPFLFPGYASG